ncbi:MAG: UDP-N-acetylglucosamine 2-epimerase (non-hydrolyzing) [Desulfatiglandaceae bacterium]
MKFNIHLIAAARPNFMKTAPVYHALSKEPWAEPVIVHTGQHYDFNMSDAFFRDLKLPAPHIHLGIGSGTHAEQTARVMMAYEKLLLESRPDLTIVGGDVNSTMACTLAAVKINYSTTSPSASVNGAAPRPLVAHLEAGLRSFDRSMPEEINRVVTDSLADLLWTPSPDGDENLLREGIPKDKIERVGNIMIDALEMMRSRIEAETTYRNFNLKKGRYGIVTLHRPANVDPPENLHALIGVLARIALQIPLVFSVHPRTLKNLKMYGLMPEVEMAQGLQAINPLSYIPFMNLVFNCGLVITDSGGLQEETTYLGIPCLTLRPNTERPVTTSQGTNRLCNIEDVEPSVNEVLYGFRDCANPPDLWDGQTARRVVISIKRFLDQRRNRLLDVR